MARTNSREVILMTEISFFGDYFISADLIYGECAPSNEVECFGFLRHNRGTFSLVAAFSLLLTRRFRQQMIHCK